MRVRNVQKPELHVYLPSENIATGKAVLLFPGGGYYHMAFEKEGADVAKWLNGQGIAGIVVKYRLPNTPNLLEGHKAPLQDAQRALRLVRSMAKDLNLNRNDIGVMGFSAGGHLAATLATQFNRTVYEPLNDVDGQSARPDFAALIYPVISMKDQLTHEDSRRNLLGNTPPETLIAQYSNEEQVTANTPPVFLLHTTDDVVVSAGNSLSFYKALTDKGISAEMHVFPHGRHGFALALGNEKLDMWKGLFLRWLSAH